MIFRLSLSTSDRRLAQWIAGMLQKKYGDELVAAAGEVDSGNAAMVVCQIQDTSKIRLWAVLYHVQLLAHRFNVEVMETYLHGQFNLEILLKELSYFLKCREIEVNESNLVESKKFL